MVAFEDGVHCDAFGGRVVVFENGTIDGLCGGSDVFTSSFVIGGGGNAISGGSGIMERLSGAVSSGVGGKSGTF